MLVRILIAATLIFSSFAHADVAWASYKSRFLQPDGRIVDTGNGGVSHTEGQGFAMLMAVENNDRQSFDKLWQWTDKHLRNPQNGLFYWRYTPGAANPVADRNNATDGDTMIAWALLRAQQRWQEPAYGKASDAIARSLLKHAVISFAGYHVMLPGAQGFNLGDKVNLNPSYFIFPAWQAFYQRSHLAAWRDLSGDAEKLLAKMDWGSSHLPSDWVALGADGKMVPAQGWPPRMSYDAVRIPMYIYWQDPKSPLLTPWRNWWQGFSRSKTPAWVNVYTSDMSPYSMNEGLLAIRDLTLGSNVENPYITAKDDYYSASLKILAALAQKMAPQ